MDEKSQRSQPVVWCDDDRAGFFREPPPVVRGKVRGCTDERTGVEPHNHRCRLGREWISNPDIQLQAILIAARCPGSIQRRTAERRRCRHESQGPRNCRLRRLPAQGADRRRRVGNAQELARGATIKALDVARARSDGACNLRGPGRRQQERHGDQTDRDEEKQLSSTVARHAQHHCLLV